MPEQQSLFFNDEHEGENVERKSCSDGRLPSDIWEVITAFSNSDGGYIYIGINDDGEFINLTSQQTDKLQSDMSTLCTGGFNHKIYPQISVHDGAIKVFIPPAPSSQRPIFSQSRGVPQGSRVRVGSTNVQVDDYWIRRFALESNGGAELELFQGNYEEIFQETLVQNYINLINSTRHNSIAQLQPIEILKKIHALSEDEKMTLFGLMVFSKSDYLQSVVGPTFNIAVTQYAGTEKVDATNIDQPFLDNQEFNGHVLDQFSSAFSFIKSKLPVRGFINDNGIRQDYLAVPEVAIRETLANAIAHRDYTDKSGRIQIDVFSDRIEFSNPGRSLVPIENLEDTPPRTRNPLLVNFLKEHGVTEQRARGIRAIKTSLREAGLREPIFEHRHTSFFATIYSSAFITLDDQRWLSSFGANLSERQKKVILHLKYNNEDGINNTEYRAINNMNNVRDDIRAKKDLQKLVAAGVLITKGENKYRRYYLSISFA